MLDLFIRHPKRPGHLVNVETALVRGHLVFKATDLKWNEDRQENDETKLADMTPMAFAAFYDELRANGWRPNA